MSQSTVPKQSDKDILIPPKPLPLGSGRKLRVVRKKRRGDVGRDLLSENRLFD